MFRGIRAYRSVRKVKVDAAVLVAARRVGLVDLGCRWGQTVGQSEDTIGRTVLGQFAVRL
jgi:hypothetical protein